MDTKLTYVIEFVADMDRAVAFYRDVIGLPLSYQLPGWSEFTTGGGDAQPLTSTTSLYPPLQPGYGEDAYVQTGCKLIRVNESHQLW